jgi:hypothetical protein
MLERIRSHYASDPDLSRVVLNAASWVEANLAVEVMNESATEKTLVTAANIREVIRELPRCPLAMAIDFEGLARVWGLEREGNAWARSFPDDGGSFSVVLLGEGNYCYDIVVRTDDSTHMWMPNDRDGDFVNPEVIDLVIERPSILGAIVELTEAMGLPFYPMFYMSLEDWRQEYAQDVFDEVMHDFGLDELTGARPDRRSEEQDRDPHGSEIRVRGVSDEGRITWLI